MPILRDWECRECQAIYEAWDDDFSCLHCGSKKVVQIFITPPAKKSAKTKSTDYHINNLVTGHGMTDFQNDPSRTHEKKSPVDFVDYDPSKDIGQQVAARMMNLHDKFGGRPPQIKNPTMIPTLDTDSGNAFKTALDGIRKNPSNSRNALTTIVAKEDGRGI